MNLSPSDDAAERMFEKSLTKESALRPEIVMTEARWQALSEWVRREAYDYANGLSSRERPCMEEQTARLFFGLPASPQK